MPRAGRTASLSAGAGAVLRIGPTTPSGTRCACSQACSTGSRSSGGFHRSPARPRTTSRCSTRRSSRSPRSRPLRFLAKEELWRYRPWGWLMDALGAVPAARGRAGYLAIDRAEELIREGEAVAIFPQGTVQGGTWTRGAARVALETGAPARPGSHRRHGASAVSCMAGSGSPGLRIIVGEPILVEQSVPDGFRTHGSSPVSCRNASSASPSLLIRTL